MNRNNVFQKVPKNTFFIAQNVLDPLLSLYIYFFIPENTEFEKNKKSLKRIFLPLCYSDAFTQRDAIETKVNCNYL